MYSHVQFKFPLNRVESPLLILAVMLECSVAKTDAHSAESQTMQPAWRQREGFGMHRMAETHRAKLVGAEPSLLSWSLWKEALFGTVACEQMAHIQVPALPPNNSVPLSKRLKLSASFVKQDKNNSDTYFFWL